MQEYGYSEEEIADEMNMNQGFTWLQVKPRVIQMDVVWHHCAFNRNEMNLVTSSMSVEPFWSKSALVELLLLL